MRFFMDKKVYSFQETCKTLDICRNTLYELLEQGEIRGFQIGRIWKIPGYEIDKYIENKMERRPI
jgi:excisionase family DNA binding protein